MLNQAQIIGRLGKDPEVRYLPDGRAVTTMSLATSEKWKDKQSGEQKESTEWHRCTLYDRLAEVAGEYLVKGALVYVAGKIKTRKWTDQQGIERYTTEIHCNELKMLGGRGEGGERPEPAQRPAAAAPAKPRGDGGKTGFDDMDDDIPF